MASDQIIVKGAREHNLKDVDLVLPRDQLIVFTGLSGSGKSSLAFDTIYAEGQRRYVESLSAYARQFLGQMDKPDVDFIEGLSPAISIDQKTASRNPRSTVGTVTEIHDYLRLLFARIGVPHCPNDGSPVSRQTPQQIVDRILELEEDTRFQVLAPVVQGRKGEYDSLFEDLVKPGSHGHAWTARSLTSPTTSSSPDMSSTRSRSSLIVWFAVTESSGASPTRSKQLWASPRELRSSTSPTVQRCHSRKRLRVRNVACRSMSSNPGTSRSTAPTARARTAPASVLGSRWMPTCSCPRTMCPSPMGPLHLGVADTA